MSDKKIKVPEGMLKAAESAIEADGRPSFRNWDWSGSEDTLLPVVLEAALRWLSENPIVPTGMQAANMIGGNVESASSVYCKQGAVEWQRRMFLAPEGESAYDNILDSAWKAAPPDADSVKVYSSSGVLLAESYRRGKSEREQ